MQPIKLSDKQVRGLSEQFPFWLCSYIQHQGGVTRTDASSEVKAVLRMASKYEGRSESEHVEIFGDGYDFL